MTTPTADPIVATLRGCAPYIHAHHGRVCVIGFGGEAAQRDDFDRLMYDVALLHSLGVKLVLVPGARPQIDARLAARGITPQFVGGARVTDRAALECVKDAAGALRFEIEARLSTSLASTPMGGAHIQAVGGNWITAKPVGVRAGVDHQFTGEVRRVDVASIRQVLEQDRIALVSPVGYSPTGEIFNIRAEDVATAVAAAIGAEKLIFVTPVRPDRWRSAQGLGTAMGDAGQLPLTRAQDLLNESSTLNALEQLYLRCALTALRGGVARVHLLPQDRDGALLRELYTRDGVGVMVHSDADYEATRDATIDDVGGIMALIKPLERDGTLVPRSREQLELDIQHFRVMVRDGMVIACCALFAFADSGMGELACVAVHPDYQRAGRAAALLKRVETEARALGLSQLFTLTTHTPHWFVEHGFTRADIARLPMQRQQLYNYQRNSMVLVKPL